MSACTTSGARRPKREPERVRRGRGPAGGRGRPGRPRYGAPAAAGGQAHVRPCARLPFAPVRLGHLAGDERGRGWAATRCAPTGSSHAQRSGSWDRQVSMRFYVDPVTRSPHIHRHSVDETEVEDVLRNPGEDRPGRAGSRVAIGRTAGGRYLRVVYVPDPEPDSVFVITAYELKGKPLTAFRRRRRRRRS